MFCWNEEAMKGVLLKNIFLPDLLESQYLFQILQTLITVRNNENVVISDVSKNACDGERQSFFKMKEGYKVPFVK